MAYDEINKTVVPEYTVTLTLNENSRICRRVQVAFDDLETARDFYNEVSTEVHRHKEYINKKVIITHKETNNKITGTIYKYFPNGHLALEEENGDELYIFLGNEEYVIEILSENEDE